tara:strand:+ start:599 stop:910 length:312 start_codon:yes stop_codon:yes gene_type:complete
MKIKKYFLPPPVIISYFEYQDLNKDKKMILTIVDYIFEKTLVELSKQNKLKIAKKLDNDKGYTLIFKLISNYLSKNNYKWTQFNNYYYNLKNMLVAYLIKNIK